MENKKDLITDKVNTSMFSDYGDIVSIEDIMRMLHIGKTAVYNLLKSKTIRSVRVGRKYIVPKTSIIEFVEKSTD